MPIYEYKCGKCGQRVEFLETFGDKASKSCPHCGSRALKKQFSTFNPGVKEGTSQRCGSCSDYSCPHAGN